ncbi:Sugar kinase of the NBD/HSP70 family, may contain an N-terminal HTH domain [Alkalibacterium putridalgicola]|uniref:Sugar kinase of the NBD/HSP70 family, may contain an N-terminal HTH domain n=1 Tax=Alkalibacterium putridalgicola TaxID=426703 RepID=A0A1H7R9B5_9LACT|nr:ROK family transcriptional regulator [Alkalibacterium putridalgicola]GEK88855.1 transcriptional regulator [Alkalibacterium putridalgicola]SEL56578.1 Sugar kinase of the NBD/HSP70 family, may contain an N-terminal HTH domain [Alkalibacterium putridalgicola]
MFRMKNNIRENNSLLVLSEIMNRPEISRAMISEVTGLNKATVSEIVRKLIQDDYVIEIGPGKSTSSGGRRPILLTVNKKAGISISFDVRYDRISYLITYLDGEKIDYTIEETEITKHNIVDYITTVVNDFRSNMKETPFGIIGVTISIHGIVDNNQIEFTPYFDLDHLDLVHLLEEELDLPVHIENEANLSALAESAFDTEHKKLISFSAHTGIGAGIILDGQLYRGYKGRSGEIGHTVLYPNGISCPCGNQGCLEQYCSTKSILRKFQQLKGDPSLTFDDLVDAYHQKDSATLNMILQFAKDFGIGLMNVIGNYDPEIVYINSEILEEIPELISLLNHYLNMTIYKNVPIKQSALGRKASLYGATVMNLKEFLHVDNVGFNLDMEKVLEVE